MTAVSVVVPIYNGAVTIGACLDSLLHQTAVDFCYEIIVVENGCTDTTAQVVQRYPVRLISCRERGPAAARNTGVTVSTGDILAFTDADCIADPGWLAALVAPFADPQVGAVAGAIRAYDCGGHTLVGCFSHEHEPLVNYISGEHEFLPHVCTANASYRRVVFDQLGGFNRRLATAEDIDLSWRMQLETSYTVRYAAAAVVRHQHRETLRGLCRLYYHYGFGEVLLDTLYRRRPGYPRGLATQARRMLGQIGVLPRYAAAGLLRLVAYARGRASAYQALRPWLWLAVEGCNVLGKIEALVATRGMTSARRILERGPERYAPRFY